MTALSALSCPNPLFSDFRPCCPNYKRTDEIGFPPFHGVLGKGLALSHSLFVNLPNIQKASYVCLLGKGRSGFGGGGGVLVYAQPGPLCSVALVSSQDLISPHHSSCGVGSLLFPPISWPRTLSLESFWNVRPPSRQEWEALHSQASVPVCPALSLPHFTISGPLDTQASLRTPNNSPRGLRTVTFHCCAV